MKTRHWIKVSLFSGLLALSLYGTALAATLGRDGQVYSEERNGHIGDRPVKATADERMQHILQGMLRYPEFLRNQGETGSVHVAITIGADGNVEQLNVTGESEALVQYVEAKLSGAEFSAIPELCGRACQFSLNFRLIQ